MLFAPLALVEPSSWQTWVIPAAGLGAGLVALVFGRWLVHARRRAPAPSDAPSDGGAVHDPFEKGSITEHRISVRRKGNPIEVLITDAEATAEPHRGWVVDRSTNGLCLLLHDEVAVGTVLSVKPRQSPPGMTWVRVTVRNSQRDPSGHLAGCQFVSTPPWGILLLFG
jgi:hypothetical protein